MTEGSHTQTVGYRFPNGVTLTRGRIEDQLQAVFGHFRPGKTVTGVMSTNDSISVTFDGPEYDEPGLRAGTAALDGRETIRFEIVSRETSGDDGDLAAQE